MKKWTALLLVLAILAFSFAACDTDGNKPGETDPAIQGETYEDQNFTIVVPTGWDHMEINGGVQISKASGEVIEVHYRGFNQGANHAKLQVESSAGNFKGTEPKETEFLGKTFWYTEYTLNNKPQAFYALIEDALRDGEQATGVMLSVKYGGFDDKSLAEDILKTVVWK